MEMGGQSSQSLLLRFRTQNQVHQMYLRNNLDQQYIKEVVNTKFKVVPIVHFCSYLA